MNEVGIGTRVINFVVDTILIALSAYGLYKWYTFYVMYWEYKFYPYYIFFWLTCFAYYFLFEIIFLRTPGKFLSMTKVISVRGGRPAWYLILFRSAIRLVLIDAFFIPAFNMPLHDKVSKTRVVEV